MVARSWIAIIVMYLRFITTSMSDDTFTPPKPKPFFSCVLVFFYYLKALFSRFPVDMNLLRECLELFEGEHNFGSFVCAAGYRSIEKQIQL